MSSIHPCCFGVCPQGHLGIAFWNDPTMFLTRHTATEWYSNVTATLYRRKNNVSPLYRHSICLLCLFQRRICVRATFSQCISVRATLFQRGCCCDHLTSSTRLRKEQTLYRYCALLDIMPSYSILHKIVFIRPFEKRSYYVIPLGVRPSVRPSVNFFVSV